MIFEYLKAPSKYSIKHACDQLKPSKYSTSAWLDMNTNSPNYPVRNMTCI